MSNETARLARQWAEEIKSAPEDYGLASVHAAAEHILATTTPLTMADVEWDDKEHYLSGAVDSDGIEVVMMGWRGLLILVSDVDQMNISYAPVLEDPKDLTPNGKRYELREVGAPEQSEHPETLETLKDYANAPACTVVTEPGGFEWKKGYDGEWYSECQEGSWLTTRDMTDMERQVLRWGEDEETSEPTVSSNENVGLDQHEQPPHPEVLETLEDYENAPVGTVVAYGDDYPYTKSRVGMWLLSVRSKPASNKELGAQPISRTVLRWGWGK